MNKILYCPNLLIKRSHSLQADWLLTNEVMWIYWLNRHAVRMEHIVQKVALDSLDS